MIVVSDTSPVRSLANLGLLSILQQLYGEIIIPQAVAVELSNPRGGRHVIALDDLAELGYLKVHQASDGPQLARFLAELDRGESEALALAIEFRADLILIDELAGRKAAKREGLAVIGVLGVLLDAKGRGVIESMAPLLDQLQDQHQFFIGDQLRRQILRSAKE